MLTIARSRATFLGLVAMLSIVLVAPTVVHAEDASFAAAPAVVSDQGAAGVRWAPEQALAASPDTVPYDLSVALATGGRGETAHLATVPLAPDMTFSAAMPANSDDRIANALFGG